MRKLGKVGNLWLVASAACGGIDEDALGLVSAGLLTDGTRESWGVLTFLNGPDATVEVLDVDANLDRRAARNIVRKVRGPDGALGTRDDDRIETVAELDAIGYVGATAMDRLVAYVASIGGIPYRLTEGVPLSRTQVEGILAVANTASRAELEGEARVAAWAAARIVAARPIPDVETLAAVRYVGRGTIEKLRDQAARRAAAAGADAAWEEAARARVRALVEDYSPLAAIEVAESALPAAARERFAASAAALELPHAYRTTVSGRVVYFVVATDGSGEGNPVVVDVVDGRGRWFAHGVGFAVWDGGGLSWGPSDADPTMCRCDRPDPRTGMAVCAWMDGTTRVSTEIDCD